MGVKKHMKSSIANGLLWRPMLCLHVNAQPHCWTPFCLALLIVLKHPNHIANDNTACKMSSAIKPYQNLSSLTPMLYLTEPHRIQQSPTRPPSPEYTVTHNWLVEMHNTYLPVLVSVIHTIERGKVTSSESPEHHQLTAPALNNSAMPDIQHFFFSRPPHKDLFGGPDEIMWQVGYSP